MRYLQSLEQNDKPFVAFCDMTPVDRARPHLSPLADVRPVGTWPLAASATVLMGDGGDIVDAAFVPPLAPANVRGHGAQHASATALQLQWTPSDVGSMDVVDFEVEHRRTDVPGDDPVRVLQHSAGHCGTVGGLAHNTAYSARVRPVLRERSLPTPWSTEFPTATRVQAPAITAAKASVSTGGATGEVDLRWTLPDAGPLGISGYDVMYRADGAAGPWQVRRVPDAQLASGTVLTMVPLGATLRITVAAVSSRAGVVGEPSPEQVVSVPVATPVPGSLRVLRPQILLGPRQLALRKVAVYTTGGAEVPLRYGHASALVARGPVPPTAAIDGTLATTTQRLEADDVRDDVEDLFMEFTFTLDAGDNVASIKVWNSTTAAVAPALNNAQVVLTVGTVATTFVCDAEPVQEFNVDFGALPDVRTAHPVLRLTRPLSAGTNAGAHHFNFSSIAAWDDAGTRVPLYFRRASALLAPPMAGDGARDVLEDDGVARFVTDAHTAGKYGAAPHWVEVGADVDPAHRLRRVQVRCQEMYGWMLGEVVLDVTQGAHVRRLCLEDAADQTVDVL